MLLLLYYIVRETENSGQLNASNAYSTALLKNKIHLIFVIPISKRII